MNLTTYPFGHFITGRFTSDPETGSSYIEVVSERFKQKVRFDRDHSMSVNDQIGEWLENNGHHIIAWSDTDELYIFICKPFKPLT
jgi:hypothetical protein